MNSGIPICVIGAGPCGSTAARLLCENGFRNVMLLEKKPWPRAKPCAGGLGPRARTWLARHRILSDIEPAASKVSSLYFTAPSGRSARLVSPEIMALVLPRERFDDLLVQRAIRSGANFRPSTRVTAVRQGKDGAVLSTPQGELEASAVVVAAGAMDGIHGLASQSGKVFQSIFARFDHFPHNPFEMEMIFPRNISPFYAWLFPEPEGVVNIGLIARPARGASLHSVFDEIIERYFASRIMNARMIDRRVGSPVRCGGVEGGVLDGCVVRAGEGAGLVNGATAEGIPYALESGELAATAIVRSVRGTGIDRTALLDYRRMLRRRFAVPLEAAAAFRAFAASPLFPAAADIGTVPAFQRLSAFALAKV